MEIISQIFIQIFRSSSWQARLGLDTISCPFAVFDIVIVLLIRTSLNFHRKKFQVFVLPVKGIHFVLYLGLWESSFTLFSAFLFCFVSHLDAQECLHSHLAPSYYRGRYIYSGISIWYAKNLLSMLFLGIRLHAQIPMNQLITRLISLSRSHTCFYVIRTKSQKSLKFSGGKIIYKEYARWVIIASIKKYTAFQM